MTGIEFFVYRRTARLSDYIPGGRGLNPWVVSLNAQPSDMSGRFLLGLPEFACIAGIESLRIALGLFAGTLVSSSQSRHSLSQVSLIKTTKSH